MIEPFLICLPVMSWAAVAVVAPTASATSAHATMVFRTIPSLVRRLSLAPPSRLLRIAERPVTVHRSPVGTRSSRRAQF